MMHQRLLAGVLMMSVVVASCGSDDAPSADTIAEVAAPEAVAETTIETMPPDTAPPETAPPETAPPDTTPPQTTSPETTPPATITLESTPAPNPADPGKAASAAWLLVFDSTVAFDDKAPFLADAEALLPTVEAYSAAGAGFGGISLAPTGVDVSGESAAITYDVNFGANPAYSDQNGTVDLIGGVWTVSRDEFCSFMASARVSCP